jgi:hypothetical protein
MFGIIRPSFLCVCGGELELDFRDRHDVSFYYFFIYTYMFCYIPGMFLRYFLLHSQEWSIYTSHGL